ncbi:MAG: histidine triad nucleotide-binding protein [Dehalococcoidales bacterium]|jgi:histidine triad (HIT) family protein
MTIKNPDCIFCKIVAGQIPARITYRDEEIVVFEDIAPAAPVHLLVIPVKHIASVAALTAADAPLAGSMIMAANRAAKEQGLADKGYRLIINNGKEAGQVVPHFHIHILGGRPLDTMG